MDKKMDRRQFINLAAVGAAATSLTVAPAARAQVNTNARIIIIGAGAGGTALANRLTERLDGATITVIDPRPMHVYQPGLTLVAAGLKPASYVVSENDKWLPRGVTHIPEKVMAVDPEAKTVSTETGQTLGYDWLVMAS